MRGAVFAVGVVITLLGVMGLASGKKKPKASQKTSDNRPTRVVDGLTIARPLVTTEGMTRTEKGKLYMVKGTVPASLGTNELTTLFEANGHLARLNYAKTTTPEGRGFQVIYHSPSDWVWDIPGEVSTLRFPNRVVSIEEIIE
jgi:hypothetical protein